MPRGVARTCRIGLSYPEARHRDKGARAAIRDRGISQVQKTPCGKEEIFLN